jgi:hypothetical protein
MEKINFESLRQEDLGLRRRKDVTQLITGEEITDEEKDKAVGEIKEFIAGCREAGKYIPGEEERDYLRAILRHWGTVVYNASGVYSPVDLADPEIPAPKTRIKFSPVSLLVAAVLVLLVGAIASPFALDYLSVRQAPTPTATVQPPVVGDLKVSAPAPLKPGEEVVIFIEVSRAAGATLIYTWIAHGGQIVGGQGSPAITYLAPDEPGTYNVGVVVEWDGGRVEKTTSIKVELPPTDTPVPPTDTLVPPTDTPVPPTDTPTPTTLTPTPLSSSASVVNANSVDQPPMIDGRLDEEVWSRAQPLTYAQQPPINDLTAVVVRLLWDDQYLYVGFDVSDTQVEDSTEALFDSDSVSVIIDNGGQIWEYRHSLLADGADYRNIRERDSKHQLKGGTTFNEASDQDEGYSIEMRIRWSGTPAEGSTIAADFLSVDHDYNPGKPWNDPDTVFSKMSWDGDGNVDTALNSILLSTLTSSEALVITDPSKDAEVGPIITARGEWVEAAERGDLHLEVLVRSLVTNEPYWVQSRPDIASDGTWRSVQVRIGRMDMDVGTHFDICAVATVLDLKLGEQLYELPEGPNFCVLIIRK